MVKNSSVPSYEIISRNHQSDQNCKVVASSDHSLVPSDSEKRSSADESRELDWNFYEHFDQVDNQLRIEVFHVTNLIDYFKIYCVFWFLMAG